MVRRLSSEAELLVRRRLKLSEGGIFRYCIGMIVRKPEGHIQWEVLLSQSSTMTKCCAHPWSI